jgi:hypothetical protein
VISEIRVLYPGRSMFTAGPWKVPPHAGMEGGRWKGPASLLALHAEAWPLAVLWGVWGSPLGFCPFSPSDFVQVFVFVSVYTCVHE